MNILSQNLNQSVTSSLVAGMLFFGCAVSSLEQKVVFEPNVLVDQEKKGSERIVEKKLSYVFAINERLYCKNIFKKAKKYSKGKPDFKSVQYSVLHLLRPNPRSDRVCGDFVTIDGSYTSLRKVPARDHGSLSSANRVDYCNVLMHSFAPGSVQRPFFYVTTNCMTSLMIKESKSSVHPDLLKNEKKYCADLDKEARKYVAGVKLDPEEKKEFAQVLKEYINNTLRPKTTMSNSCKDVRANLSSPHFHEDSTNANKHDYCYASIISMRSSRSRYKYNLLLHDFLFNHVYPDSGKETCGKIIQNYRR